nr:hypothetical protein OG781_41030 [Streptomyces sp. NBC_00830]
MSSAAVVLGGLLAALSGVDSLDEGSVIATTPHNHHARAPLSHPEEA